MKDRLNRIRDQYGARENRGTVYVGLPDRTLADLRWLLRIALAARAVDDARARPPRVRVDDAAELHEALGRSSIEARFASK